MFAFIVFPNVETHVITSTEKLLEAIEIPIEIIEQIRPPDEVVRSIVNIEIIDDDLSGDDSDDNILTIDTIDITRMDMSVVIAAPPPVRQQTPRGVRFEEAPVVLRGANPTFPEHLRRIGSQATVILEVEILIDGSIGEIEVLVSSRSGVGGFDEAAIAAVRQWEFQPARNGGQPVACWIRIPINFSLSN
jgi:TonB family protein